MSAPSSAWLFPGRTTGLNRLRDLGFASTARQQLWRRGDLSLGLRGEWLVMGRASLPAACHPGSDRLGRPGLWRLLPCDGVSHGVFELPARAVLDAPGEEDIEDDDGPALDQCLAWAERAAEGLLPDGWVAPSSSVLEEWFTQKQLTVVHGPLVRQANLYRSPDRLALSISILPAWPADAPESRRRWLAALVAEARASLPMVRLGFVDDDPGRGLWAEVDLSGAPPALQECLLSAGLAGLRRSVIGLAETVELLADANVASEVLATFPEITPQLGKENADDRNH